MFWTKEKIYLTRRKPTPQTDGAFQASGYLDSIIDFIPLDEIESINDSEEINQTANLDDNILARLFEPFVAGSLRLQHAGPNERLRPSSSRGSNASLHGLLHNHHARGSVPVIQIRTQSEGLHLVSMSPDDSR